MTILLGKQRVYTEMDMSKGTKKEVHDILLDGHPLYVRLGLSADTAN